MKRFEEKWQVCVGLARRSRPREETPPAGFVGRVLEARAAYLSSLRPARAAGEESVQQALWMRLGLRALAVAGLLLMAAWLTRALYPVPSPTLRPPIEHAIAEQFHLI